jgi:hypothetical protein
VTVAMTAGAYEPKLDYKNIISTNKNWIGAGFVIPLMSEFSESYLENVRYFI